MTSTNHPIKNIYFNRLLWMIAGISCLLSLIELLSGNPINPDGIFYLRTAAVFLQSGWHAAMALYPWPFFSVLIAEVSQVTDLSLIHSAYLIDIIFQALIMVGFVKIVRELTPEKEYIYWAAVIIMSYPYFNSIRAFIVRDFGYWAFALLAILYLIRYQKNLSWKNAIGWGFFMAMATLFRIEGAILLMLGPLALLLSADIKIIPAIKNILRAYTIPLCGLALILGYMVYQKLFHAPSDHTFWGRGLELVEQVHHGFFAMLHDVNERAQRLGQNPQILTPLGLANAKIILITGLIGVLIFTLITTLTPLYAFFVGYSHHFQLLKADRNSQRILWFFILINFAILIVFLGQWFFIDKRYLVLLCLLLMLWVPAALVEMRRSSFKLFIIVCLLLVITGIGGLIRFGHSKAYMTESGLWLKEHTTTQTRLFSNSVQVLYYADRNNANWEVMRFPVAPPLSNQTLHNYDYAALRFKHEEKSPEILKWPIKVFQNRQGDRVEIYRLVH